MNTNLPSNVHISRHPCLTAKLSRLRSYQTNSRETNALVYEIALIIGCEALANTVSVVDGSKEKSPLGYEYTTQIISPKKISLVPILRSGLGMLEALKILLPDPVSIHHLGLFREPTTLQPVEYYNNLPFNHSLTTGDPNTAAADLAIIIDPIIATGGTCVAAIQTLREWGVKKVLVVSILGNADGVKRAADEWPQGVEVWVGGIDPECDAKGMIKPGLGDIGDRLFMTLGK
ncbi:MAG: hypothetical protein M1829_006071 [Trizodia sp. TS-e1964]|nr:MAG: hypothetical protein M1829_006071 [Trizodia sp. TS-e1964]